MTAQILSRKASDGASRGVSLVLLQMTDHGISSNTTVSAKEAKPNYQTSAKAADGRFQVDNPLQEYSQSKAERSFKGGPIRVEARTPLTQDLIKAPVRLIQGSTCGFIYCT